jgi:SAM-dependent methyltransferase
VTVAPEPQSLDVAREILSDDPIYAYNPGGYFDAGASALRNIRLALLAAQRGTVNSILDFGCGGGRVMRYLRAAFPQASLTACDLYPWGVDFCARAFGARPLLSKRDLGDVELDDSYDLIWVGSLFTHVGEDDWDSLLRAFAGALAKGGVLVFTAYGRNIAEGIRDGRMKLNLKDEHLGQIVSDYDARGFGFFPDFEPENRHGDSLATPAWVCDRLSRFPSLSLLLYSERAWLNQDVIACVGS